MKTSRSLLGGYVLFVVLGLVDLGVTWSLVHSSGGHVYESNPVAQWCLGRWGWTGLVGFKLGLILVATTAFALVARSRPRAAAAALTFSCAATFAVIVYSCTLFGSIPGRARDFPYRDEATLEAEGRSFDEQLRQGNLYRLVLEEAAGEFLLGRSTLEAGVARLTATPKGRSPAWLAKLREVYPGLCDSECLMASILDRARALQEEKPDEYGVGPQRLRRASTASSLPGGGGRQSVADALAASPPPGSGRVRN